MICCFGNEPNMGTTKPTIKELDARMNVLHSYFETELNKFRSEMNQAKTPEIAAEGGEVGFESLKNRFIFFEATIKNEMEKLQGQVNKLQTEYVRTNIKLDGIIQHQHRGTLLIHGIEEKQSEDLYLEIKNILENKLDVRVNKQDIAVCYRYGRKLNTKARRCRPVAVEFVNRWKRDEVFWNKKRLKGTNLMCTEYLSPIRYSLFKTIKSRFGKNCWTKACKIGFVYENTVHYVTTLEQMSVICGETGQQSQLTLTEEDVTE